MTARDTATAILREDCHTQHEIDRVWLKPDGIAFLLHLWRNRRAAWLIAAGMAETPKSERAGRMIRALLAVAGEA